MNTIVILGTAEWNATIATNQHYVARHLSEEFDLVFIEGYGTRRPRFTSTDLQRAVRRLMGRKDAKGSARAQSRIVPPNASIRRPFVLPWHTWITKPINTFLLWVQLGAIVRDASLLWTFTPLTYGLDRLAPRVLFHLVDLIHENEGAFRKRLVHDSYKLSRSASVAIGTSTPVVEFLNSAGFTDVKLMENVADVQVFLSESTGPDARAGAVFAGNITPAKVDISLIEALVIKVPPEEITLIGPLEQATGKHSAWLQRLHATGVKLTPAMKPLDLAKELGRAKVGLIPYELNALTVGVSPLKTYEYLAAGLPVVAIPLPSMCVRDDAIWIESSSETWATRVAQLLAAPANIQSIQHRQDIATEHSWLERGSRLNELAHSMIGTKL